MNTRNLDWRTVIIALFVIVFLLAPFIGLVQRFLSIPAISVVTAFVGAMWFMTSALNIFRIGGKRSALGSTKVTYWRGERIETRQPARSRVRAASNVQLAAGVWFALLGFACSYATVLLLLGLFNAL